MEGPLHPLSSGTMLRLDCNTEFVPLRAVNDGIVAVPLAGNPMLLFELVQLKFAPDGTLVGLTFGIKSPWQADRLDSGNAIGNGFTVRL